MTMKKGHECVKFTVLFGELVFLIKISDLYSPDNSPRYHSIENQKNNIFQCKDLVEH